MTIQLEPKYLKVVKDILKHYIPGHHVLVFGSRVTSSFKPHSDLDLCILGNQPVSFKQLAELREEFSESDLPIRVDIVDWATLSTQFRDVIKQNAIRVC